MGGIRGGLCLWNWCKSDEIEGDASLKSTSSGISNGNCSLPLFCQTVFPPAWFRSDRDEAQSSSSLGSGLAAGRRGVSMAYEQSAPRPKLPSPCLPAHSARHELIHPTMDRGQARLAIDFGPSTVFWHCSSGNFWSRTWWDARHGSARHEVCLSCHVQVILDQFRSDAGHRVEAMHVGARRDAAIHQSINFL